MELIAEIWRRARRVQPIRRPTAIALVALVALGLVAVPAIWPYTRMLVTITHEGGHALTLPWRPGAGSRASGCTPTPRG